MPLRGLHSFPTRRSSDLKRKSVEEVAGEEFSRSAMPKPCDQRGSPSRTTAAESPGMLFADIKLATAFSMAARFSRGRRSEEHTSELQSLRHLVCRLLLEK